MAIARPKAGLSTSDLETVRAAVAAGRKPKVVFTDAAGQIAGRTGQVVRLEDPAAEEWLVVRFGKDELPFAPADLQFPAKPSPVRSAAKVQSVAPPQWSPAGPAKTAQAAGRSSGNGSSAAPSPAANGAAPKAAIQAGPTAGATAGPTAGPTAGATDGATASATAGSTGAGAVAQVAGGSSARTQPAAKAADPAAKPARKTGSKRSPELSVTLTHEDGHWTVQAHRGAKVLVKPAPVRASDALKMVGMLDVPPVRAVVEEIVEAARVEAEQQAERLRRELAEVEAALADLNDLD